jgi:hypothetical protein
VGEPVLLGISQLGKDFDVLVVVHLEVGEQQPGAFMGRVVETEGFLVAEHTAVELARGV